ncbi:S8 family serine peptidase [Krasilnikovia sp. MM14-A1004]|uniref:S8 family serine peptidase n=1 Tax=Krasilnikovia sp. MM14-A1004 TaxID=3373541 RepID=UPI00399C6770
MAASQKPAAVAQQIRARWKQSRVRVVPGTGLLSVRLPAASVRTLASVRGVRMVEPDLRTRSGPAPKPAQSPPDPAAPPGAARPDGASGWANRDGLQFVDDVAPDVKAARDALGVTGDADGDPTSYSTSDVVVAVVDSGIDDRHFALSGGKVLLHRNFVSMRAASCGAGPESTGRWDESGHGTHVAGIVAGTPSSVLAKGGGVAPGAALLDLKVFDCTGSGWMSDVDAALGWLLQHHREYNVRVVNMSLGASVYGADGTDSTSRLVDRLMAAGVQVVVAAGNSGSAPRSLLIPAAAPFALTIGAANGGVRGEWLAQFSSRGPTGDNRPGVDLTAFGVDVASAYANHPQEPWISQSGTSMAAPVVAGVVALLADARPDRRPSATACAESDTSGDCADGVLDATVRDPFGDLLRGTARDWFSPGIDAQSGAGILRGGEALARQAGASLTALAPQVAMPNANAFNERLVSGQRVVVPVDATDAAASVTVVLAQPDDQYQVKLRWLNDRAGEDDTYDNAVGWVWAGAQQYSTTLLPGTGRRWLEIRSEGGAFDLQILVTATHPPRLVSDAVHLEAGAAAAEGGAAATADIVVDRPLDHRYTFQAVSDGQLTTPDTTITVGPAEAGTRIHLAMPVTEDSIAEGRHSGLLGLVPAPGSPDDTPVLRTAVAITDDDGGPVTTARVLLDGAQFTDGLEPDVFSPILLADDGTIVSMANSQQLRDRYREAASGYGTPIPVVVPAGSVEARPLGLAADGTVLRTGSVRLHGLSADGRTVLASLSGWGYGVVDGDTDDAYELFAHDMATGRNIRVGLTPAQRAGQDANDTMVVQSNATLSADGSTVAFLAYGSHSERTAQTLGLYVSSTSGSPPRRLRTVPTDTWIQAVTADQVVLATSVSAVSPPGVPGIVTISTTTGDAEYQTRLPDGAPIQGYSGWQAVDPGGHWLVYRTMDAHYYRRDLLTRQTSEIPVPALDMRSVQNCVIRQVSADGRSVRLSCNGPSGAEARELMWTPATQAFQTVGRVSGMVRQNSFFTGWRTIDSPSGTSRIEWSDDPGRSPGDTNTGADLIRVPVTAPDARQLPQPQLTGSAVGDTLDLTWPPVPGATTYQVRLRSAALHSLWYTTTDTHLSVPAALSPQPWASVTASGPDALDSAPGFAIWNDATLTNLAITPRTGGATITWDGAPKKILVYTRAAGSRDLETSAYQSTEPEAGPVQISLPPGRRDIWVLTSQGLDLQFRQATWPTITVPAAAPSITLTAPATLADGADTTVTARADGGAPVTLSVTGPCTLAGETLSADRGAGACTVTAATATATATAVVAVQPVADTVTVTAAPSLTFGTSTAVTTGAGSGRTPVLAVTGPCSLADAAITATAGTGTCHLTARTPVSSHYRAASAGAQLQLSPAINPITINGPDGLGYRTPTVIPVDSPAGPPVLSTDGPCTVDGTTVTATEASGTCTITATSAATTDYLAGTSEATVVLRKSENTITLDVPSALSYGGRAELTAHADDGGVAVLTVSGPCTLTDSTVLATSGVGTCTITATTPEDEHYLAATATAQIALQRAHATVTVTAPSTLTYSDRADLTTRTSSGATADLTATGPCTLTGNTVLATSGVGTCTITATTPETEHHAATTATARITLLRARDVVTVTAPATLAYKSRATITVRTGSGRTASLGVKGTCALSGTTVTATLGKLTCDISASVPESPEWTGADAIRYVSLVVATPAWPATVRAATTAGRPLRVARGRTGTLTTARPVTSFGHSGSWQVRGNACRLTSTRGGAVSVVGHARGTCTITLAAAAVAYQTRSISRTWVVKVS